MSIGRPARIPPSLSLMVRGEPLVELLRAVGAPAELVALAAQDPDDVSLIGRALFVSGLAPSVAAPLHKAATLVTSPGRFAVTEALDDPRLDCRAIVARERAHLHRPTLGAIAVARAAEGDTTWQQIVHRAFVRVRRSIPDPLPFEVWARAPIVIDLAGFRGLLESLPDAAGEPWIVPDPYGDLHAVVPYVVTTTAVASSDGAVRVRDVHVLAADVVSISPGPGRARITTADPERALALVTAMGARGLADPRVMLGRPAFTLRRLVACGPLGLATMELPSGVRSLKVLGCQVVKPDGDRDERRGKDALATALKMIAKSGYLHRVTLRLAIDGADELVDVFVQLPNRVSVSDVRFEREASLTLTALGIDAPGTAVDDILDHAEGPRAAFRCRETFGDALFESMKAAKLLVLVPPSKSSSIAATGVALPELRAPGDTARVWPLPHPLDEGNGYALADDPLARARTVTPRDRETWQLDRVALAKRFVEDLGLDARAPCKGMPDGVLDLGLTAGGHARVAYALTRVPEASAADLVSAVTKAVLPAHLVLLAPLGLPTSHALAVELTLEEQVGIASVRGKLAAVLEGANFGALAPPNATPARGGHVVVSLPGSVGKRCTHVSIDGAIREVRDSSFVHLFALLAAAQRGEASWQPFAIQSTREALHDALYRLRKSLEDLVPPDCTIIEVRGESYRLSSAIRAGEIAWALYAQHPNPEIQKLARRRPKPR